jgi:hypothetical protein
MKSEQPCSALCRLRSSNALSQAARVSLVASGQASLLMPAMPSPAFAFSTTAR